MDYLAILDYDHLDNGIFMKSFAEAFSRQTNLRGLILHSDSAYTERLVQTGMLTEDAQERSVRDLNHRLVALLADHGIPGIGINGYHRKTVIYENGAIKLNTGYLMTLPESVHLIFNTTVFDADQNRRSVRPLKEMASALLTGLKIPEVFVFTKKDSDEVFADSSASHIYEPDTKNAGIIEEIMPNDLHDLPFSCKIITARAFANPTILYS